MAKKQDVVRFAVGAPDGPQSLVWRLWASRNTSDVYLAPRNIAGQAKLTFHKSDRWRLAFTKDYASGPNPYVQPGEDRATAKWQRPPEVAPGITRAFLIMVPSSELVSPNAASTPDTIWISPAPIGLATCLTIYFLTPVANVGRITAGISSISSFFQSVGHLKLLSGETVWVVAHHQQMTESQKEILSQGRVNVARSSYSEGRTPERFNSAYLFGLEKEVGYYLIVSDKGLPSTSEGWLS